MLSYDLESRGDESRYVFLYHCIRDDILSGELGAGERLPSKRRLAEHLGVGVVTVESAYAQLVAEGYVEARERRGYFVARLPQATGHGVEETCRARFFQPAAPPAVPRRLSESDESAARLWSRALRASLSQEPAEELFGPVPWNGAPRLRAAIARYVEGIRGFAVDPECVVVGAGAQVLYNLVVQLLGRGFVYAVEDPGYPRLTSIYRANACDLRFVPLDGAGVSMAALRACGASVVHLMPSHQFPTGRVTSAARRYELLAWANEEPGRYIVEDDYDCEFRLAGRPIPALCSMDTSGRVIYLGTFSKSLSSALRMAYAVLPPRLMERARRELRFYSTTVSALDQVTLARILEDGDYERHVNRHRTRMRAVRDALLEALAPGIDAGRLVMEEKDSGLHFVLGVRDGGKTHVGAADQGEAAGRDAAASPGESASPGEVMPSGGIASSAGSGRVERADVAGTDDADTLPGREQSLAARASAVGVRLLPLSSFCHDATSLPADGLARFVVQYDSLGEDEARRAGAALLDLV